MCLTIVWLNRYLRVAMDVVNERSILDGAQKIQEVDGKLDILVNKYACPTRLTFTMTLLTLAI